MPGGRGARRPSHQGRGRRTQRNRLAASKCRKKSKEKNEIMLEQEKELEQKHQLLKSCVDSLRDEVLDLREELLKHAHCDCEPIQHHIAKSIRAVMAQPSSPATAMRDKMPSPPLGLT